MANPSAPQISDTTRRRILTAIGGMTEHYKAGSTPDEALTKVALEYDLLPDQLRIVGRGFNSGQTLTEIGKGQTLAEKTAGVRPLADIEGVIKQVYSGIDKASGKDKTVIASVYLKDPTPSGLGKAAFVQSPVNAEPTEDSLERPPVWVAPNMYSDVEKKAAIFELRRDIQAADKVASDADLRAKLAYSSMLDELKKHVSQPEKVANLLFDARRFHGDTGHQLLKQACGSLSRSRADLALSKVAQFVENGRRVIPSSADHSMMTKLAAACDAAGNSDKAKKNQVSRRMYAAKVQRMIEGKEKVARLVGPDMGSYGKQVENHLNKFAMNVTGLLGGMAAHRAAGGLDPNSTKFREAELAIEDPGHDQQLQKIRLRATLQSLMDYDPIIQSYDPDEVLTAFNELSQSAPASIDNPVMLTANLRRLLQGDVAPFEAVQMQSADSEQRKLIEPIQAQLKSK